MDSPGGTSCLCGHHEVGRQLQGWRSHAVALLLAIVFTGLAVGCALYSREIFVALGKGPYAHGRTEIWKLSLDSAMKRPLFGYGYRAFWTGTLQGESAHIALLEKWTVTGAHNGLLETWLDLGLIGVGMFLSPWLWVSKWSCVS